MTSTQLLLLSVVVSHVLKLFLFRRILNFGLTKITKIWLHIKPIFRLTDVYQLEQKHVWNGMVKTANEVIEAKKIELAEKSKNETEVNDEETEFRKPQIFVDQLFKGRHVLSMEEISHEINVFILGVRNYFEFLHKFHKKIFLGL